MNKNYFSPKENFEAIIKKALDKKQILKITNISTGWTNIVYEVETDLRKLLF